MIEDGETKTTMKVPTDLLDDFKHLAIDMKTTVTALIIESMRPYLKEIKVELHVQAIGTFLK